LNALALFSKDLFNVEEIHPTFEEGDPEMINFEKMRMLWKLVSQFFSYKEKFQFSSHQTVRAYLDSVTPLPENELYELSYKHEPRKA